MGSMVSVLEQAPPGERGYYGSLTLASANGGGLLGSAAAGILHAAYDEETILAYAWRLPFLCGVFLAFGGVYLQRATHTQGSGESPMAHLRAEGESGSDGGGEPHAAYARATAPLRLLYSHYKVQMLTVMCVAALWSSSY